MFLRHAFINFSNFKRFTARRITAPAWRAWTFHTALRAPLCSAVLPMAQDPATDHIPSQSQDLFTYSPIDNSYSVRILTLKAGSGDEPLVGYLTVENLDYNPDYEAISYVWGTEGRCSEILLDFKVLPLTRSIHDALKRMRHPTQSRRLWADQICINQDDIAERSQQVGLMNAIYKGAKHILVWLGPDEDGVAKDAVTHIHHLHGIFDDDLAHDAFKRAHSEELLLQSKEPWVPFSKLTRLPWVSDQGDWIGYERF